MSPKVKLVKIKAVAGCYGCHFNTNSTINCWCTFIGKKIFVPAGTENTPITTPYTLEG